MAEDPSLFRIYEPHECGKDGYPFVWHGNVLRPGDSPLASDGMPRSGTLDEAIHEALDRGLTGLDFRSGVKHLVRAEAGHRCIRCGHPFRVGESGYIESTEREGVRLESGQYPLEAIETSTQPEQWGKALRGVHWSPCDEYCSHGGPIRVNGAVFEDEQAGLHVARGHEVEAAWRILTVHHLNGRKHDLRWWNLCALDQRCHLRIQRAVQMERVYMLEHSPWFKPYAAGWYAYAYLGLSLTREETMVRLDELLSLERA